jgi:thiamine transport system ATP-binding protein
VLDAIEIVVAFDDRIVLDHVSLHVARAEIVALQGPSGSGKSTLLRVIAGLLQPQSGTVRLDGRDITTTPVHRRSIGLVFQDNQLFPHRDVAANVEFGLQMMQGGRGNRAQRARRVGEVLHLVGLEGFESRSVSSLSGGEAKRVALARSLAPAPPVLLLDEPLTGLDQELHDRLADDLASVLRTTGTTAVVVTHDRAEAEAIADRVQTLAPLP